MSQRSFHKLIEKHILLPVLPNESININLDCPHCHWSTCILVSMIANGRVSVVGEGLRGHTTKTVTNHDGQPLLHLEFAEHCAYTAVHDIPPPPAED